MRLKGWKPLIILALVIGLIAWRATLDGRPNIDSEAKNNEFSATRAHKHVTMMASKPHPIGSQANHEVRDYILQQLKALHTKTEILKYATIRTMIPRVHTGGNVENILATIPGKKKDTILFVAHYDSVSTGPGAGDDISSVASFLETIRMLKYLPAPNYTIQFLFTDGEEGGLLGANAFVENHNLSHIKAVFDFESRGIRGESILFRTGQSSTSILRRYIDSHPFAVGSSLGSSIYNLIPNDTDFTIFKQHGFSGLDFAFIDGVEAYHTSLDNPQNLDLRTLQHHGSNVVGVIHAFAFLEKWPENIDEETIYFPFPLTHPLYYSGRASWIFAVLALIFFVSVHRILFKSKTLTTRESIYGFLWVLSLATITALLNALSWVLLQKTLAPSFSVLGQPYNYSDYIQLVIFLSALCILIGWFLSNRFYLNLQKHSLVPMFMSGAYSLLVIFLVFSQILLPGASYLFVWPSFGFGATLLWVNSDRLKMISPTMFLAIAFIFALPSLFFGVDILSAIFRGLTVKSGWLAAFFFVVYGMSLIWLVEVLLNTLRYVIPAWTIASVAFSLILVLLNRQQGPSLNALAYTVDKAMNRAAYFSCDSKLDSFTSRFFERVTSSEMITPFPVLKSCLSGDMFLLSEAPVVSYSPPVVHVLSDKDNGESRIIDIRIRSGRQATGLVISVRQNDTLERIIIFNKDLPLEFDPSSSKQGLRFLMSRLRLDEWHTIILNGMNDDGVRMQLFLRRKPTNESRANQSEKNLHVSLRISDRSRSIVNTPELKIGDRPSDSIQQPEFPFADGIYATKIFEL